MVDEVLSARISEIVVGSNTEVVVNSGVVVELIELPTLPIGIPTLLSNANFSHLDPPYRWVVYSRNGTATGSSNCRFKCGDAIVGRMYNLTPRVRAHHGARPTPSCPALLNAITRTFMFPGAGWTSEPAWNCKGCKKKEQT